MQQHLQPKVVVIGGGTGSFTLLQGLKQYVKDLTALVNMSDDGGSAGILRDELGVLPPGDVRQCLVALSDVPQLRDLFNYRFNEGTLQGHSFGNLFLSAVEKMTDSFEEAVALASEVLHIQGRVVPVTTHKSHLVLTNSDGEIVRGEHKIGHLHFRGKRRPTMSLEPEAALTEDGKVAIEDAGMVIIAPGNLYGSLAPTLIVQGMREALLTTKAKIVYVCNLVTKPNQTDGFTVIDYADEIERFVGAEVLDYVIYNTDEPPPTLLKKYTHEGEEIVEFDLDKLAQKHYHGIGLPLIDKGPVPAHVAGDAIGHERTLIRHDTQLVARQLMELYSE